MTHHDLIRDARHWTGADGWTTQHVSQLTGWRIYHLLRGGVDNVEVLAELTNTKTHEIARLDRDRLFLSADNTWMLVRDDLQSIQLPRNKIIVCRCCGTRVNYLPCQSCHCPPDWLVPDDVMKRSPTNDRSKFPIRKPR